MSLKPESAPPAISTQMDTVPATSNSDRDARCRRSIDDFVAERMTADEFHHGFRHSTGGDTADPRLVGLLRMIRQLCDAYVKGLPTGAGYRVSAEQFRSEVCHIASLPTARAPTSAEPDPTPPLKSRSGG